MSRNDKYLSIIDLSFPNSEKNRFYAKVLIPQTENGCMEWIGSKCIDGYGHFRNMKGNAPTAHRYAYLLFNGPISADKVICHSCDNPSCVNPNHLFLASQAENIKDRDKKYRTSKGVTRPGVLLNDEKAKEIKLLLNSGIRITEIANRYGVNYSTISAIKHNRTWRHI